MKNDVVVVLTMIAVVMMVCNTDGNDVDSDSGDGGADDAMVVVKLV